MKRALWAISGVLVFAAITSFVMTHPNLEKLEHLNGELEKLKRENDKLAGQNANLEKEIHALRDDPRLAERRAREAAGLARPGEVIYQFEEPEKPIEVAVKMVVTTDGMELAGKSVKLDELASALEELRRQLPGARVELDVKEGVDPIQRQKIEDVIAAAEEKE
jgi:cell division protein FtsB